jgi:Ni/Co efflux regulator RcnB
MKRRLSIITSLVITSSLVFGQAGLAQPGQGNRPSRPPQHDNRPPQKPGGPQRPPDRPGGPQRPPERPGPSRPPQASRPPIYHRPGAGRPPSFRPLPGPIFHYPRGYKYRHWGIGALLPLIFLSPNYIYSDWRLMGLEPPPPGYYWVRYGPDLLLVQRGTRRIVDVIYGAFR